MDMSTLIKTEHDNWKKRMMVETCGTYILMNMGMGFVVIAGAFCGVMIDWKMLLLSYMKIMKMGNGYLPVRQSERLTIPII